MSSINFSNYSAELDNEKSFPRIAQTIGSNIQKISQNGTFSYFYVFHYNNCSLIYIGF